MEQVDRNENMWTKKFSDDTVGGSTKLSVNESRESYRPVELRLDGSVTP